jgi:hypothetical protein
MSKAISVGCQFTNIVVSRFQLANHSEVDPMGIMFSGTFETIGAFQACELFASLIPLLLGRISGVAK